MRLRRPLDCLINKHMNYMQSKNGDAFHKEAESYWGS